MEQVITLPSTECDVRCSQRMCVVWDRQDLTMCRRATLLAPAPRFQQLLPRKKEAPSRRMTWGFKAGVLSNRLGGRIAPGRFVKLGILISQPWIVFALVQATCHCFDGVQVLGPLKVREQL